jgi:hypothetical protein
MRNPITCWSSCLILAFLLVGPTQSFSKVFYVEKDGSGDYTVIQDAVDVAASGDTIRIGVGRFDDKQWVTSPGWSEYVRVLVDQQELTIIGSGPETIIGPEAVWDESQGSPRGIVGSDFWGNERLVLEDLCIENLRRGVYASYETIPSCTLVVSSCLFKRNDDSLWLLGVGADISVLNSRFEYLVDTGQHIVGWQHENLTIEGCEFFMDASIYGQRGVSLNLVDNTTISNCNFSSGTVGVSFSVSTLFEVRDSVFQGQGNYGIYVNGEGGSGTIQSSSFRQNRWGMYVPSQTFAVAVEDCLFEDVFEGSIVVSYGGGLSVHRCDLSRGIVGVFQSVDLSTCSVTSTINMEDNYWGTTDADSISAWILDRNDSPDACNFVDFEPFSAVPLPTEKQSLGGLRAMFR